MKSSRAASSTVLAMASGRSANRRAIWAADLRWRSALRASRRPASAIVVLLTDAGEDVEDFALLRRRMADAVGGEQGQAQPPREFDRRLVAGLFLPAEVALQFGVDVVLAEHQEGFVERRSALGAGEADEALGELGDLLHGGRPFALGGAQLHLRDQAAEVLVALSRLAQQRPPGSVGARDFGADEGADADLFGRHVEAGSAIDAVAVEQRHGRHVEFGAGVGQFFGQGGAFEEAEGRAGV